MYSTGLIIKSFLYRPPMWQPAVFHKFVLWTNCLNLEYQATCNLGIYKFAR